MELFDKRKTGIINRLTSSDGYVTGRTLSLELDCSVRTIQGEVSAINRQLPGLIISTNRGYLLDREIAENLNPPFSFHEQNDEHNILRKLIFDSPWSVDELADYLYISTTTLEKRLKSVTKVLSRYQLVMARKNSCLSIEGKESDKRKLIKYLILDETNSNFCTLDDVSQYFPEINIERIRSIVLNSINKYGYYAENIYSPNIVINVIIALYRMQSDNYISQAYTQYALTENAEYRIAEEICSQYANHWGIHPSVLDISYIATLLTGQIKPLAAIRKDPVAVSVITPEFLSEIQSILTEVFGTYMLNVDFSDILYGFALHIDGMLKRVIHSHTEDNDILQNVKRSCPFIYDVSVSIAKRLAEKYGVTIPDPEIGYISIHIGFLIEQCTESQEKVFTLFLGRDYHQISSTIEKKLLENFSDVIELQTLEVVDLEVLNYINCDLILTVQPLPAIGKKTLTISPFYTTADQLNIDQAIQSCLKEKKLRFHKRLFSSYFHEKLFFKSDDFSCKEEVIRFLGRKIVEFGLCEPSFIESVLEREELSSTCFFNTFAIPHATTMDAVSTMNCVLISEKGIPWDEHLIHVVVMIAVSSEDRKEFMRLYDGIVHSLESPETVKKLSLCNDFEQFMKTLSTA